MKDRVYWSNPFDVLCYIAERALRSAECVYPAYSSRRGSRKFTQPQLAACVLLKEWAQIEYSSLLRLLRERHWPYLRKALGLSLKRIPHISTLRAARRKLLTRHYLNLLLRVK
jgi:hypothetical protein